MLKILLPVAAAWMMLAAPAVPHPLASDMAAGSAGDDPQHYVIHVPRMTITTTTIVTTRSRAPAPPAPPPVALVEGRATDCVRMQRIVGFAVTRPDSVDLVLNDGSRMRARLGDNCRSIGFYSGFYVRPNPDGKMCVNRDTIRARSGGSCNIQGLRTLVPAH